MKERTYRVSGRVINQSTRTGVAGLAVQAWDQDPSKRDDFLNSCLTDAEGHFFMEFKTSDFREKYENKFPDLYFKVFQDKKLVKSTENEVICNAGRNSNVTIEVDLPGTDNPSVPDNIFNKRNEAIRIECIETLDEYNFIPVKSFFRRLGADYFYQEHIVPIMEQGDAQLVAGICDRPWPPFGLEAQKIYALCLIHPIGNKSSGVTPVLVEDEDLNNIGLISAVYKETLEFLMEKENTHVNYLVIEGSVMGDLILRQNGFERSQDEIFLTEDARYHIYHTKVSEFYEKLQLSNTSSMDLLAHDVAPEILLENAQFHNIVQQATRPSLLDPMDRIRTPEWITRIDSGLGGLFKPAGVDVSPPS